MCRRSVRSILLLPPVARYLETIDQWQNPVESIVEFSYLNDTNID